MQKIDFQRAKSESLSTVLNWFKLLEEVVDEEDIKRENIYNMDETGTIKGVTSKTRAIVPSKSSKKWSTQAGKYYFIILYNISILTNFN